MNQNIPLLILIGLVLFLIYNDKQKNSKLDQEYDIKADLEKKINVLSEKLDKSDKPTTVVTGPPAVPLPPVDLVKERDRRVRSDVMYPPLGRTERPAADMVYTKLGLFNYPTRGSPDTYRPIALAKDTASGTIYHLMGRQKYYGSSLGEYYLATTDRESAVKIPVEDKQTEPRLRDIYNVPEEITFTDGVYEGKTFKLHELPKSDFQSEYI